GEPPNRMALGLEDALEPRGDRLVILDDQDAVSAHGANVGTVGHPTPRIDLALTMSPRCSHALFRSAVACCAAGIDVAHLTKRYGDKLAVDDLTFQVSPGTITGFLGPNGAGKSTTMRMMVGLDAPTSGAVSIDGRSYRDLPAPLHEVGTMLEARAIHT